MRCACRAPLPAALQPLYPMLPATLPHTGDPDAWEAMLATNTLAPMRLTRRLAPAMAARPGGGGLVVTVGSLAGTFAAAGSAPYAASKWGVRGWVLGCYEVRGALLHAAVRVLHVRLRFGVLLLGADDRLLRPRTGHPCPTRPPLRRLAGAAPARRALHGHRAGLCGHRHGPAQVGCWRCNNGPPQVARFATRAAVPELPASSHGVPACNACSDPSCIGTSREDLIAERMIQPSDIAEAALLPLRLSPDAVPLEVVMKVRLVLGSCVSLVRL